MEEEEPESGSLQLGGEPEDRDIGRVVEFQRRPSTQLPIQRTTGGPFGPSLSQNFSQNFSNLSSINGRTLTPAQQQQLLAMKSSQSQSGFMDQFPPGMGNQLGQGSALFQQQGHNRQSSRYSFANDSSASASVKPSANQKLMGQQSSMMPSGSHAQQGSQFYGSSIPGPPPGLKSSGTPPISGGMFAQGHGFGGAMGGSSVFSGLQKETSSDMLRDMLRSRGVTGSGQSHDTGKREYMFPSFLQQYPSASSTPAPASGLASLYGPQTGAFHDFGQKQKKKGKKHRHANTSSSGGGGLVDLADPSILQARMQHQQQSNAGVGQGLFGGQAQGGYNPSMMYNNTGFARW
jgi:CCR4-NOT transcription complex subunit 4